jgi:hypothetical protein
MLGVATHARTHYCVRLLLQHLCVGKIHTGATEDTLPSISESLMCHHFSLDPEVDTPDQIPVAGQATWTLWQKDVPHTCDRCRHCA